MTANPRIECSSCGKVWPDKPWLNLRKMVERFGGPKCECGGTMGIVEQQASPQYRVVQLGPGARA